MLSMPAPNQPTAPCLEPSTAASTSERPAQNRKRSHWKAAFVVLVLVALGFSATAPIYNIVARFSRTNGGTPSPLTQGPDGYLYGTTQAGGPFDAGTFFKIGPGGLTVLYTFGCSSNCSSGGAPVGGLVLASDGNFYGTTSVGGPQSSGTIFKVTPSGTLTTIATFCTQTGCPNGQLPMSSLIQGSDSNLYGTTILGGTNGGGTIFKLTPQGVLSSLYSFCQSFTCPEGNSPAGPVVQGPDGNFYGTNSLAGSAGWGTAFKVTPTGVLTTLHTFCVTTCADGAEPSSGLTLGSDGNFYGLTLVGGSASGSAGGGTVFKMSPDGTLTTIYTFCNPDCSTGKGPAGNLIEGTDHNLYGSTAVGGSANLGTIFSIDFGGALTSLHTFTSKTTGEDPVGSLMQSTNGIFLGSAPSGVNGLVYSLSVGLGPFVETVQASGKAGQIVSILGQGLTGTTGVSFNGTAASYVVVSDTYLKAKVPTGASSGLVTVTTPSGTLTSNKGFVVRP